jgi:folate-binding protein YgfZ
MPDVPSPLLQLPGAVEADPPDAGVAAHYGSPSSEQRRLAEGDAFVDLSHREVIAVTGEDRLTWLHSLATQDFESLAPFTPADALILSPQGHIEHAFQAIDDGDDTALLNTEPGAGEALVTFLDRMRFMSRVVVELRPELAVVGLPGLRMSTVLRSDLESMPGQHGDPAGLWAWEALRIAAGRPRFGVDTDHRTIPNEVGLLNVAVHLDKGCYRGQETVARVHNLGRPPRRLVMLHLDGSVNKLPAVGSDVLDGDRVVGHVGSSARHYELGPIALAIVKRNTPVDAALETDGIAASQEVVVDPEVGLHVHPAGLGL